MAARIEADLEGTWPSIEEAMRAALDLLEKHRIADVRRVEIDTRQGEAVTTDKETVYPPWKITVEGYLAEEKTGEQ